MEDIEDGDDNDDADDDNEHDDEDDDEDEDDDDDDNDGPLNSSAIKQNSNLFSQLDNIYYPGCRQYKLVGFFPREARCIFHYNLDPSSAKSRRIQPTIVSTHFFRVSLTMGCYEYNIYNISSISKM